LVGRKKPTFRLIALADCPRLGLRRLMLNVLGSVAQFEREVMLERQREGIAKAKGEGKYKGRAPTARAKSADIRRLAVAGLTREAIAAQLGVSVRSVYRVLGQAA
jgi:DNA invertase Pin-like site-specific DNA recombinase